MADQVSFDMVDCWPAQKRKQELQKLGLSVGGSRNAQVNRLYKALSQQHEQTPQVCPPHSSASSSSYPSSGRVYCVVCPKYGGMVQEDGSVLSLHRIPDGQSEEKKQLRRKWIKALKLFRVDFPSDPKSYHRVCDDHFPGGYKPGAVPTSSTKRTKPADISSRRRIVKKTPRVAASLVPTANTDLH